MRRYWGALIATVLWCAGSGSARAGDVDAKAILDRAKKATSIEIRRDKQSVAFIDTTDFKVLDRVHPGTFAAPK